MRLSLIIPAYNEAARLGASLAKVFTYLNQERPDTEVIIVDDGSSDATADIAEQYAKESGPVLTSVIRVNPNRGKGHAVRVGLQAARAQVALFSDADFSSPITELPKLIAPIESGECDVAFGSRALDRSLIGTHQPWRREQGGKVFNLIVRLATRLPYWDTQCGFKAFRLDVARPLIDAATIDRFGFDVEYLYLMYRAGLRLREIPVRWDDCEGSKLNAFSDSLQAINEVRLIRRQMRRGLYEQALALTRQRVANAPLKPQISLDTVAAN